MIKLENTLPKWVVRAESLEEARLKLAARNRPEKQCKRDGRKREDLTGKRLHKITVLESDETSDRKDLRYICKCDCGLYLSVRTSKVKDKRHCGCEGYAIKHFAQSECRRCGKSFRFPISDRQGIWCSRKCYFEDYRQKTPIEVIRRWKGMMQRCYNPKHHAFKNYGGRGISVCSEWHTLEGFAAWHLGQTIPSGTTMDRKDNNGNYEPNNIRWATRKEQGNNCRNNVHITAFSETKTISEWSRDARCPNSIGALAQRLRTGRWSVEDAITVPASKYNTYRNPRKTYSRK